MYTEIQIMSYLKSISRHVCTRVMELWRLSLELEPALFSPPFFRALWFIFFILFSAKSIFYWQRFICVPEVGKIGDLLISLLFYAVS